MGTRHYRGDGKIELDLEYSGGYNDRAYIAVIAPDSFKRHGIHLTKEQTHDLGKQLVAMSGIDELPRPVIATGTDFIALKAAGE